MFPACSCIPYSLPFLFNLLHPLLRHLVTVISGSDIDLVCDGTNSLNVLTATRLLYTVHPSWLKHRAVQLELSCVFISWNTFTEGYWYWLKNIQNKKEYYLDFSFPRSEIHRLLFSVIRGRNLSHLLQLSQSMLQFVQVMVAVQWIFTQQIKLKFIYKHLPSEENIIIDALCCLCSWF